MTSELRVDNLKGSTTGGSINVLSEGTSATTNLQQGLAKAWCTIELDDTIKDSFNSSSFTDNTTGDITHTFSNAMSSKEHVTIGFNLRNADAGSATAGAYGSDSEADISYTTTVARIVHLNAANVAEDMRRAMIATHGDLA